MTTTNQNELFIKYVIKRVHLKHVPLIGVYHFSTNEYAFFIRIPIQIRAP